MAAQRILGGGFIFLGVLAYLEGLAHFFSGVTQVSPGSKHRWLEGFFLMFGSFAPHVAALVAFCMGSALVLLGLRILRSPQSDDNVE